MIAALLHDQVLLEDGLYELTAGPSGSFEFWIPERDRAPDRFQTPSERARRTGSQPIVLVGTQKPHIGDEHLGWQPTFHPLKAELKKPYRWIDFATPRLNSEGARLRDTLTRSHLNDAQLLPTEPLFVRRAVLDAMNADAIIAIGQGTALSVDRFHSLLTAHRVRTGLATPVRGPLAASVVAPRDLTWDEVHELRAMNGFREWRAVIRDVERTALTSGPDFESGVLSELAARRDHAVAALLELHRTSPKLARAAGFAVGVISTVLGVPAGLGLAAPLAADVAASSAVESAISYRWLTFDLALRRASSAKARSVTDKSRNPA